MTPTLFGRWQTRLLLLATVGILITIPFSEPIYFSVLAYIAILGLFWDVVYDFLQKFRWDRDWPGVYQLLAAIWEAIFLLLIGRLFFKRNFLQLFLGASIKLEDIGWDKLMFRWASFFVFLAILNEFVWRTQTEEFWINFKVWGILPITLLFTIFQLPLIKRHKVDE